MQNDLRCYLTDDAAPLGSQFSAHVVGSIEFSRRFQMFESRLSFLEFAFEKMVSEVEEMMVGMEERKKGEQDVEGVKQGDGL